LHQGNIEEAKMLFQDIRTRAKEGMLYLLSTQYLAYISYEEGKSEETYNLLLPLQDDLSSDALTLLQKAAFDQKNYPLVIQLGAPCYQAWPSVEVALRNALACAALSQATPAVGWLETAQNEGLENLNEILQDPLFDSIRQSPEFLNLQK
jgi:stage IV sporulation protein FB